MRILHVCNEYPPCLHGGIGTFTKVLCEKVVAAGHQVAVVGYNADKQRKCQEVIEGVSVFWLPRKATNSHNHLLRLWHSYTERQQLTSYMNEVCCQFHPDVVETCEWNAPIISSPREGRLVVRLHRGHGMNALFGTKRPVASSLFWEKWLLRKTHNFVAVSSHIKENSVRYYHLRPEDISVIFNGVDTIKFTPDTLNAVIPGKLLYVGRIVPPKGLDCLFRVLDRVFNDIPEAFLELAGGFDEDYHNKLLELVSPRNRNRIHFLGRLPNEQLPKLYSSAHLCVFPSFLEAFSVAVLEAMSCGTPIVYSNLPGVRGDLVVNNGIDGFVCNPQNLEELYQTICKGLKSGMSMRDAARRKAEIFSWDNILKQNLDYYQALVNQGSSLL